MITVLGNHDLHLIAVHGLQKNEHTPHTFDDVLEAPEADQLVAWLREQPLMVYDKNLNYAMFHAGVHPSWSLQQALLHAHTLSDILKGESYQDYLANMYGNEPAQWEESLGGWDRLRVITNFFTRVRLCEKGGKMDFAYSGQLSEEQEDLHPWFDLIDKKEWPCKIVFGHWAALQGHCHAVDIYALDTGYVWGGALTAMRLEDQQLFSVKNEGGGGISEK